MTDESLEARVDDLEHELNHERTQRDELEEEFGEFQSEVIRKRAELKTRVNDVEETLADMPSASGVDELRQRFDELEAGVESFGELATGESSTKETRARDLYVRMIRNAAGNQGADDNDRYSCKYSQAIEKLQEAGHMQVSAHSQIARLEDTIDDLPGMTATTDDANTKVLRVDLAEVPDRTVNIVVNRDASDASINDVVRATAEGWGGNDADRVTVHNQP